MIFTSPALLQLGHALAVRSERESLFTLGALSNRPLLVAVVGTALLQVAVVYAGPAQAVLGTEALDAVELSAVLLASTGAFVAVELEKFARRRGGGAHTAGRKKWLRRSEILPSEKR